MHQAFRDGFEKVGFLYADPNKYRAALRSGVTTSPKSLAKGLIQEGRALQEGKNTLHRIAARGESAAKKELKSRGYTQGTHNPALSFTDVKQIQNSKQVKFDHNAGGFVEAGPSTNEVTESLRNFRQRLKK